MKVKPWLLAVLVFCLVFSMLGGTAFGASARYAIVTEVVGDVTVAKAGGALEIPVSVGMRLHEGDRLSVGKGGFLTLKTSDREDEIAIGENWRGTLSKLRDNDSGGTDTALKTWAGSMYSNVRKKTGTNDTYKVETPTAVMDARGTHFTVVVDRFTGLVKIVVNAGVVQTGSDSPDDSKVPVMPSQQATVYPWMNNWADLEYIDPEDITVSVSAEVIAKLLKNKALIDEENEELLNRLAEYDEETDLNLQEEEVLAKYKSNVEHMLSHILKAAAQAGKLDSVTVEDIIETVNRSIAETNKQFDLERDVPPIDRSAGIDPEKEEQRRQMREQAERSKQEKQQQIDENRKNVLDRNQELKDRIEKQKEEQELENRLAEEKKITEASEQRRKQLEEDRQKALDERRQERETKDRSQEETDSSPGSPDDPIATSTSIQLSDSSIVYGQSFTFTAEVKTSASGAVPDGGIVAFKIGESFIGFATIADGKATLTVDKEKWASPELSGVPVGVHNVSAVYAGVAQQYGSSTSPAQALTIAKADTIVELAVNPDPPKPGDILDIRVNVAVKEPGGGEPTGMITLYRLLNDEWQPADEPIRLEPGMQSVSFQDTFLKDTGASEMQYKAEFVSDKGRHNNGMSEVKEIVVQPPDPVDLPPIVHVKKAAGDESHVFEIVVDLANFTVEKAVYGAELHFRHPKGMEPIPAFQYSPYNSEKFDSNHLLDKDFIITWRETEGNAALITIFDLRLNDPDHAVEFSGMENMAKIRFELYDTTEETAEEIDDITVELVYCRFTGRNGEPIDVSVQPGEGIISNLSE